jgi:hypothetical protein
MPTDPNNPPRWFQIHCDVDHDDYMPTQGDKVTVSVKTSAGEFVYEGTIRTAVGGD